ncbi:hypothetical protein PALB_9030 [Pseudoalteromonas luteoviolacea B = ATCC 29581]|nr:hypothetical protein PALB_9030 [Pseudoalteromonas luteoviolacea B = ATCC 29581]
MSNIITYPLSLQITLTTYITMPITSILLVGVLNWSYVLGHICQYHLGLEVR